MPKERMMEIGKRNHDGKVAVQLMVGPGQLRYFGESGILACLDYVLDALAPRELILSIAGSAGDLARRVVDHCERHGVRVSLWVMVFADRPEGLTPLPFVRDARGNEGYGSLGAWADIGTGDEKFLFQCPTAVGNDEEGVRHAIESARSLGAGGIFLDRIRYPSPANGLEFLGACSCPRCTAAYRRWSGEDWPDLTALAIRDAAGGAEGADRFMAEARRALQFRSLLVATTVARYAEAAHAGNLSVGLDLFAPSLAPLVGQDYRMLSGHADFMKPMLYCKAFAPAGLPLEFSLFIHGLELSGVEPARARDFTARLSGLDGGFLDSVRSGGSFPAACAATELARCQDALDRGARHEPEIYAGIELVEHDAYATRIGPDVRDAYLESLSGQNIAVCWNILYVPRGHIDAIASERKDLP